VARAGAAAACWAERQGLQAEWGLILAQQLAALCARQATWVQMPRVTWGAAWAELEERCLEKARLRLALPEFLE
jgi:hypothetical protein